MPKYRATFYNRTDFGEEFQPFSATIDRDGVDILEIKRPISQVIDKEPAPLKFEPLVERVVELLNDYGL